MLLLRPLVREMARRRPNWQVVISTSTSTGLAVARRVYPDLVTFYAPLDFSWSTRRAIARIRPTVLALVELELWPNLIRAAKRSGAKVAIINARLSTRSYRGYRSLRRPLQPTLGRIDVVAAQNSEYARRFVDLGIPSHRISVTGSVKYDGLESDRNNVKTRELRQLAGPGLDRPGVCRRQHDGRRRSGRAGGLQHGPPAAPGLETDPGSAARRAIRRGGSLARDRTRKRS